MNGVGIFRDARKTMTAYVSQNRYDLIVMDLLLPFTKGGQAIDASGEVSRMMSANELNRRSYVIALSEHQNLVDEQKENFLLKGIILQQFDHDSETWEITLTSYIARVKAEIRLDFIIICALEEEREAYFSTVADCGEKNILQGLDCQNLQSENFKGLCILLPTMGLVEAAIVTTRAIEKFSPRLVAMSGVCGGYSKNSALGQLLIANPTWEYQSGIWSENNFNIEPYQADLSESVRLRLKATIDKVRLMDELETDISATRPCARSSPRIVPFASGSAVVASTDRIGEIADQHRKIAGIDMEMYGVYKSLKLSCRPDVPFFGVKTVVDFADEKKEDDLHEYGAIISERFTVNAIIEILT